MARKLITNDLPRACGDNILLEDTMSKNFVQKHLTIKNLLIGLPSPHTLEEFSTKNIFLNEPFSKKYVLQAWQGVQYSTILSLQCQTPFRF